MKPTSAIVVASLLLILLTTMHSYAHPLNEGVGVDSTLAKMAYHPNHIVKREVNKGQGADKSRNVKDDDNAEDGDASKRAPRTCCHCGGGHQCCGSMCDRSKVATHNQS